MSNRLDEFFEPFKIGDLVSYNFQHSRFGFVIGVVTEICADGKYRVHFVTKLGMTSHVFHSSFLKKLEKKV